MSEFRLPITELGHLAQAGVVEDRYRLGEEIARGGMGAVFRARDELLDREVAVKILLAVPTERPDLVRRFVQEARITGRLQHPGIPAVYDRGLLTDGRPFLAMKLIQGRTLADLLRPGRDPVADRELLLAAFELVCQTVAYAHAKRIVHRDLKPSNVMVGAFGEVQVVDWGLARGLDDADDPADAPGVPPDWDRSPSVLTDPGRVMGTPAYMPPERIRGERGDERSDVFGLGAILCEILTGSPPYESQHAGGLTRLMAGNPSGGLEGLRDCGADPRLIELACRCLSPDPWQRPADAFEVARALGAHREWVADRLRQAERDEAAEQARDAERAKRRRLTAGALVLAAVLGTVVFGFAWRYLHEDWHRRNIQRVEREAVAEVAEPLRRGHWAQAIGLLEAAAGRLPPDPTGQRPTAITRLIADAQLARDLEEVRLRGPLKGGPTAEGAGYRRVFHQHGWGVLDAPTIEVADRIERSAVRREVSGALHGWLLGEPAGPTRDRLTQVLDLLTGDDPWLHQARRAVAAPDLIRLGETLPADPPPLAVLALARRLDGLGGDHGMALRREAQRRQPQEFWYKHDLATQLIPRPGRRAEAVGYARAAVSLRPDEPAAWNNLGVALLYGNDPVGAARALARATRLWPDAASTRLYHAEALLRAGRTDAAEAEADLARQSNPTPAQVELVAGLIAARRGDEEAAEKSLRRALALDPRFARAGDELAFLTRGRDAGKEKAELAEPRQPTARRYYLQAVVRERAGDLRGASESLYQATLLDPDEGRLFLAWAGVLDRLGTDQEAFRRGAAALQRDPGLLPAFLRLRFVASDVTRPLPGLEALADQLRDRHPERAETWVVRGLALVQRRRGPEAEDASRRALAIAPRLAAAHLTRGLALEVRGELDAALTAYFLASAYGPKDPLPLQAIGTLRLLRGETTLAQACFEHMERRGLDPVGAAIGQAQALMAVRQWTAAEDLIKDRLAAHRDDARLLNTLGTILEKSGRPGDAQGYYERALKAEPTLTIARVNLAQLLFRLVKREEGLKQFRQACDLDPGSAIAHLQFGRALVAFGKLTEAESVLRRALELDDTSLDMRQALADVLMQLERDGEAETVLWPAVQAQPKDGAVRAMYGRALLRSHRYAQAIEQLKLADEMLPKDPRWRMMVDADQKRAERMQALERKLDAVLAGTDKLQATEALDLADICARGRGKPVAAALLLVTFFAGDPMLATDPARGVYLRAARIAVQAAAEPGADARRWRRQALTWLDREVDNWQSEVDKKARTRAERARALQAWLAMPSLAAVRDESALAELPPEEAAAWRALWRRIKELV